MRTKVVLAPNGKKAEFIKENCAKSLGISEAKSDHPGSLSVIDMKAVSVWLFSWQNVRAIGGQKSLSIDYQRWDARCEMRCSLGQFPARAY